MYVGLAALLALSALVLLGTTALTLGHSVAAGVLPASIIGLLDQLLLLLLIVELLYTVHVSFREHVLTAPPFLLVALIAAVRRILVLTPRLLPPSAPRAGRRDPSGRGASLRGASRLVTPRTAHLELEQGEYRLPRAPSILYLRAE